MQIPLQGLLFCHTWALMRIHVVGIGGKGMAPVASLAVQAGHRVSGDDLVANHRTSALRDVGVDVAIGTNDVRRPDADAVVVSGALPVPHGGSGRRLVSRLGMVQRIADQRRQEIVAVAGSFGKSTATVMTYHALTAGDPSIYVGADVPALLCGGRIGPGQLAVVEACEYRDAYQALRPSVLLVLNVYAHHEDWFGQGTAGFARSLGQLIARGVGTLSHVVMWNDVPVLPHGGSPGLVQVVGFDGSAQWRIQQIAATRDESSFRLDHRGRHVGTFAVPAPGQHLITAAACAAVSAILLGSTARDVRDGLGRFVLPQRRMSVVAEGNGVRIIDDNARHPAQVAALTQALRQAWPDSVVHLLVSPWGKRNARDLSAWAEGLSSADTVWVMPVGGCATTEGGAEDPRAAEILARLICQRGHSAHVDFVPGQLADAVAADRADGQEVVIAGVGYDANTGAFAPYIHPLQELLR